MSEASPSRAPLCAPTSGRLREIAAVFLKLGFLGFGGPAAHAAMMEDELVRRRGWVSRERFLEAVAAVQIIPGPNSTELAIHMGQLRGGLRGLLVAGACFIGPAVLITLPLAWLYVRYHTLPAADEALHRVAAVVLAIVLVAGIRLAGTAVRNVPDALFVAGGLIGALLVPAKYQPEIAVLLATAVAGILLDRYARRPPGTYLRSFALWPLAAAGDVGDWLRLTGFFLKVGATLFGSGYVLVNHLQTGLVDELGWMTQRELGDAIAVGQTTPGPLLTTSTFAGYLIAVQHFGTGQLGAIGAALLATAAMFAPAFVFVALLGPVLGRVRERSWAKAMLRAMSAAAAGLLMAACWGLAATALRDAPPGGARAPRVDWINMALLVAAVVAMLRWRLNATWIVVGALAIGGLERLGR